MEQPDAGAMQLLFAVYDRNPMEMIEDEKTGERNLWLCVPPDEARLFEGYFDIPASEKAAPTYVVPEEATTALFDRGWIEWDDATNTPVITDSGKYHLERWLRAWLTEQEKENPNRAQKGSFSARLRWLKRATLPEIQAHYRLKTPEEWRRTVQPTEEAS